MLVETLERLGCRHRLKDKMVGEADCHVVVDMGWEPKSKRTSLVEGGALVDLEGICHSWLDSSFFMLLLCPPWRGKPVWLLTQYYG